MVSGQGTEDRGQKTEDRGQGSVEKIRWNVGTMGDKGFQVICTIIYSQEKSIEKKKGKRRFLPKRR